MNPSYVKKVLAVAVILLFISMSVIPSTGTNVVKKSSIVSFDGNTLYVGGNGPGNYSKIQDAINDANHGDTVFVYNDSSPYYERVLIYKSIYLIGEDKHSTVIDADKKGSPIRITADDCLVSGFTIQNCKKLNNYDYAPVQIHSSKNVTIKDNIITIGDMEYNPWVAAIDLYKSTYNTIQDNYIYEENHKAVSDGIILRVGSSHNIISGNNISNYVCGIEILADGCCNNTISENHIHHNGIGIENVYNNYNKIINNRIQYNSWNGIRSVDVHYTTISGNTISHNGEGFNFECGIWLGGGSSNNYISDNVISKNNPTGLRITTSHDNVITGNNFIDNYGEGDTPEWWWGNAYFYYGWDFFKANNWEGNYWSDSITGGLFPKIITGLIVFFLLEIRWINIDWHPAQEPYDIPTGV